MIYYDLVGRAFLFASIYILSVLLHEVGHYVAYKNYYDDIKIKVQRRGTSIFNRYINISITDYKDNSRLTTIQYRNVLLWGIVGGLVPLVFVLGIWTGFETLVFLILYFYGARKDLYNLYLIYKKTGIN